MTTTRTSSVKIRKLTYLGKRCEQKEIPLGSGAREIRTRWVDQADPKNGGWAAGTVTSTTTKGNALKGTLVVLVPTHVVEEF